RRPGPLGHRGGSARGRRRHGPVGDAVPCRFGCVRVVAIAGLISIASPAYSSTESRALTKDAFSRAYELRVAESLALLADARRSDPSDPAPVRAAAAVTWMEILFAQGVATFAAFDGDASGDAVSRPAAPPHLAQRFLADAAEAVRLAQRATAATPD